MTLTCSGHVLKQAFGQSPKDQQNYSQSKGRLTAPASLAVANFVQIQS